MDIFRLTVSLKNVKIKQFALEKAATLNSGQFEVLNRRNKVNENNLLRIFSSYFKKM